MLRARCSTPEPCKQNKFLLSHTPVRRQGWTVTTLSQPCVLPQRLTRQYCGTNLCFPWSLTGNMCTAPLPVLLFTYKTFVLRTIGSTVLNERRLYYGIMGLYNWHTFGRSFNTKGTLLSHIKRVHNGQVPHSDTTSSSSVATHRQTAFTEDDGAIFNIPHNRFTSETVSYDVFRF